MKTKHHFGLQTGAQGVCSGRSLSVWKFLGLLLSMVTASGQGSPGGEPASGQLTYTVTDLSPFGAATAVNNAGQVLVPNSIWSGGNFRELNTPGHSLTVNGLGAGGEIAGVRDGVGVRGRLGALSRLNTFIPRLGGTGAVAYAISPGGLVAGSALKEWYIFSAGIIYTQIVSKPVSWSGSRPRELRTLGTNESSTGNAVAVNASGQVVGRSETGTITNGIHVVHATLWSGGSPRDLHGVPPPGYPFYLSVATAINDEGVVVGTWNGLTDPFKVPFVWIEGEGMRALPITYPNGTGWSYGEARGINNANQIVGSLWVGGGAGTAILWDNGELIALQSRIPTNSGWSLQSAFAINDVGWIVGSGRTNGAVRAFLLRPAGWETNPCAPRKLEVEVLNPGPSPSNTNFTDGEDLTKNKVRLAMGGDLAVAVAADGASRLLLRFTSPNQEEIKLSLRASDGAVGMTGQANFDGSLSSPGGTEREQTLKLTLQAVAGEPQAFAVYHAPEDFTRPGIEDDQRETERMIQFQVIIIGSEECPGARRPVSIMVVRPPVVVMHGIWSSRAEAFGEFETEMHKLLPGIQIFGSDYNNSTYFSNNRWVLRSQIVDARETFATQGIVARRADVFAHSMGGVLSRIWANDQAEYRRPDNHGAGDIHKLVTIDSPHFGSFLCNYRDQILEACPQSIALLEWLMGKAGKPIDRGAVADNQSYSGPILGMNLTTNNVPSHVIAGDAPSGDHANQIVAYLSLIGELLEELPWVEELTFLFCIDDLLPIVFPGANDLVVSVNSQLGGLQAQSVFDHEHSGAANRADVIERAFQLLNTNSASRAFARFPSGVPPREGGAGFAGQAALASAARPLALQSPDNPTLHFVTPAPGAIVQPGQLVDVAVDTTPSTPLEALLVVARDFVELRTNAPFAVQLRVPTNAAGPLAIAALARDSEGRRLTNAIEIQVQPASAPGELEVSPPIHYFVLPGTTLQLAVHGVYGNGVRRNVTASGAGTTYISSNPNVVTVTPDGLLVPQGPGETTVMAYNGVSASMRVVVALLPSADLGLRVEQTPAEVWAGVPASAIFSLTNAGPAAAMSVVIRVELPAGAQIVGSPTNAVCQSREGEHFCVFESLAAHAAISAQFAVMFTAPGDYQTRWSVNAISFDPQPDDNAAAVPFHVSPLARPEVSLDHPEALEQLALNWRTGTNSPWFGQTNVSHDGVDAAQSGVIGHSQQSWLEVTNAMANEGIVSWWWKVSSESGYDFLRFYLNGVEQPGRISGEGEWQQKSLRLPPGTNVLRWAYGKDGSGVGGAEAGWVDEVQITAYADPLADTDADGLPDLWEAGSFGSFGQAGVGDFDRDGISNADEYLDGSDPTDSTSFFPRLTVNLIDLGSVARSPDLTKYANGQTVTLTAMPAPGHGFIGWSGSLSGSANPRSLIMNGNKTVTAVFTNFVFLGEAVEYPALDWVSGGNAFWFKQTNVTHDGVDAAQSGPIANNGDTWMQVGLTGPKILTFWWKVSSENGYDFLRFLLDGVELPSSISGNMDWQFRAVTVAAGPHVARWRYSKDAGSSSGQDAGWVDEVQLLANSDGDDLPDLWEMQYFSSLEQTSAGDYDHDGTSNLDEYLDATDPTNNTSFFARLTVNVIGLGRVIRSPNLSKYTNGQTVRLTAFPDVGHSFLGWSGSLSGADYEVTLVMNGSRTVTAEFTSFVALGEAVEQPTFDWRSGGNTYSFWFKQTNVTHDGVDAAQSGPIADTSESSMEAPLMGPGILSFWWKVSSEDGYDYLRFVLEGSLLHSISGEVDWQFRSVNVGFGPKLARWQYFKDSGVAAGQDAGWLDEVNWVPFRTTAVSLQTDGSFQMALTGVPATTCTIQVSSDLVTWHTLATIPITQPVTTFVDSAATNHTHRFYRALLP